MDKILRKVDQETMLLGLIGHPVRHSPSSIMHNAAFSKLGMNYAYLTFDVADLQNAVRGLRALNSRGFNVTIPYKENVLNYIDALDEKARQIGAVNTVVNDSGVLKGYNTDWYGVVKSIESIDLEGKSAAVIGAGGSARAIIFALKQLGLGKITVFNRAGDRAKAIAKLFGCDYSPLDKVQGKEFDILLNATPVGMHPNVNESPVPKSALRDIVVFDSIYNPLETKLLKDARANGCKTINGVNMLVWQGAMAFELWTGKKAPVDLMKKVVVQKLK